MTKFYLVNLQSSKQSCLTHFKNDIISPSNWPFDGSFLVFFKKLRKYQFPPTPSPPAKTLPQAIHFLPSPERTTTQTQIYGVRVTRKCICQLYIYYTPQEKLSSKFVSSPPWQRKITYSPWHRFSACLLSPSSKEMGGRHEYFVSLTKAGELLLLRKLQALALACYLNKNSTPPMLKSQTTGEGVTWSLWTTGEGASAHMILVNQCKSKSNQ